MREIKFRGKKYNGKWVYGDLLTKYIHHKGMTIVENGCVYHEVAPETVGQYTGAKDKNNKESYENDIIKVSILRGWDTEEWIEEIVFHDGSFGIWHSEPYIESYKGFYPLLNFYRPVRTEYKSNIGEVCIEEEPVFEVIGNKWDNPELLKKEK